ncbi:tumor susceptibility gene 101 protein-like [Mercenaria mercenaria]|uniref:tumor susceptibility gene 101 protein-like n=1 Tax=Mercenaria mercenaria TaxID=6596 RepID=UPI00234E5B18|nr:tumor susceptibility gene 101 protein-like [Mercenaria mercenaria]
MSNYEQFLKSSLNKYKNPDIAKRDVLGVFTTFGDLRPKIDDFVFNDGTRKSLLQLDGTIPVNYKGSIYNIPICIWLMDTHPYNPPMVYVRPTSTMQIKSGRNVDMNGKIDLPYLREWKYPNSDLLGMIQILTIVFGEEPPVYSRQQQQQPPVRYPNQTPYPPTGTGSFPMPMPGMGGSNTPYSANTPYPASNTGYPQNSSYPGQYTGYQQPPSSGYQGYPTSYPSTAASSGYPGGPTFAPTYSQTQASNDQTTSSTASNYNTSGTSTVTEEHLKASLLSAVEDKMKWRLKETFAQAQAEMDVLYKTQADLLKGKDKLESMIRDLEKEKSEIGANIVLLKQKDGEVKETLSRLENQEQIGIDDAVVTTAPLYRQLLKAFAEEQAIEDAIYYLSEALRKDVIDLEVFLKRVRELSRKQFMLRALIQKCREKAGLPPLA